jgi:multidrug efflux pump subunit AcrA (membrane-fusion protein)
LNDLVDTTLPVGATASVDAISGKANNAILIPVEALHQASPGQYWVFVQMNGKLTLKKIDIGLQDTSYVEVTSGLQVGDFVSTGISAVRQ